MNAALYPSSYRRPEPWMRIALKAPFRLFAAMAILAAFTGCIRITSGQVEKKGLMHLVWEKAARRGPSPGEYRADSRNAFQAIEEGNLYALRKAMARSGLHWGITNEDGQGMVEAAVRAHEEEILEYLLQNRAPMIGADAFMYALEQDAKPIFYLLLQYKVDLNQRTREGLTPLIASIMMGDPELVQLMVEHGARTDYPAANDELPLEFAARKTNKLGFPDADFNYAEIERVLGR